MKILYMRIVIICFLLLYLCQAIAQAEKSVTENDEIRVSLLNIEPITSQSGRRTGQTYVLNSLDKQTNIHQEFTIQAKHASEFIELKLYKNRLLIWEKLNSGAGDSVMRVNLQTLEMEDRILMYHPAFSHDNRFVVYVGQYPRILPQNAVATAIVKIYDFGKSPSENRINPEHRDPRRVGIPIFPEEDVELGNENSLVYDGERRVYSVSRYFLWLNDRQIVFIVRDRSLGEYANFLVLLDIKNGLKNPRTIRKRIDSSLSSAFRDGITDPLSVKELSKDGGDIVITTYRNYGPLLRRATSQEEDGVEQKIRIPQSVF